MFSITKSQQLQWNLIPPILFTRAYSIAHSICLKSVSINAAWVKTCGQIWLLVLKINASISSVCTKCFVSTEMGQTETAFAEFTRRSLIYNVFLNNNKVGQFFKKSLHRQQRGGLYWLSILTCYIKVNIGSFIDWHRKKQLNLWHLMVEKVPIIRNLPLPFHKLYQVSPHNSKFSSGNIAVNIIVVECSLLLRPPKTHEYPV